MGIGHDRDEPMLARVAEHNRRVNTSGGPVPTNRTVSVKVDNLHARLSNLCNTLSQIRYRLAPHESKSLGTCEAAEVPATNIHFHLDMCDNLLDTASMLADGIDNLV